jgi:uncharacterized protein (DUF1499 family)
MSLMKIALFAIALVTTVTFFTLYRNGANLLEPPGFSERLKTFLTTHTAATKDNHEFKELRAPVYNVDAETLYERVIYAATALGWQVISHDSDNLNVNFLVRSPVFLFEDDVYVQVRLVDSNSASLYVQSSSRKAGADFAANSGHIQALLKKMTQ